MLTKLKATLAQYPLPAFFALAIAALVVFVVLAMTRSSWPAAMEWLARTDGAAAIVALIALACCWAISEPESRPRAPSARIVFVAAVTVACMTLILVQTVLLVHSVAGGRSVPLLPSVRSVLTEPVHWFEAIVAGLVLSGVVSSSGVVRRLARSLVSWRGPRVRPLILVALLAPAALSIVAVAGAHLMPAKASTLGMFGDSTPVMVRGSASYAAATFRGSASYAAATFPCQLLLGMPFVFAWYGFVAERLERRVSPLVVGLLIGLAVALPSEVVPRLVDFRFGASFSSSINPALIIASQVALAILAVWLTQRAQGSLLPAALMLAAASVAGYGAFWWAGSTLEQANRAETIYVWSTIAFVALLALFGQTWRRTQAGDSPPASVMSPPASGRYEVVVKDIGMPV